ncbi:hypothetical protein G7072_01650 [Nocardioides sp. HDW12B]|uniref:hypothetical protein n=1 Tax=Nocardioides sp. HDW12B TaxID=2714939 RepID=UPI00140D5167|nr:hypothetical protein [Nocardioides sp. HDW12B]QIK65213.1 hypothetical protein G7072_01650 [Nocardioides sp. HDW12B]
MTELDPFEVNEAVIIVKLDLTLQGLEDPGYAATVDRLAEEHGPDLLRLGDPTAVRVELARLVQEKVHASAPLWPTCPMCATHPHALHPQARLGIPHWMCATAGISAGAFNQLPRVRPPKERKPKRGWFR